MRSKNVPSEQSTPPQLTVDEFLENTLGDLMTDLRALCRRPMDQIPDCEAASASEQDFTAAVEPLDGGEAERTGGGMLPEATPADEDLPSNSGQVAFAGAHHRAQAPRQDDPNPPSAGQETIIPETAQPLASMAADIRRIADKLDPPPVNIVGSEYVAGRLGCTTTWVAEMCRKGDIPTICVVPGTGNGKLWKFYRQRIDAWLVER